MFEEVLLGLGVHNDDDFTLGALFVNGEELEQSWGNVLKLEVVVLADVQVVQVALQNSDSAHIKDRNEGAGNQVCEQENEDAGGGGVNVDGCGHGGEDQVRNHSCAESDEHLCEEHERASN